MKIGILTYHCVSNFGAQLQTVSSVGYMRRRGHEPVVLHWFPKDLEDMYRKRVPREQFDIHMDFAQSFMPLSNLCRTEAELVAEIDRLNLDAVFCGSDALFKYLPVKCRRYFSKRKLKFINVPFLSVEDLKDNPFFGGFIPKLKRNIPAVAFSVSSQNCMFEKMTKKEKLILKNYIDNFSYISTRDEWTGRMVNFLKGTACKIEVTPDPVFSFNQNNYLPLPSKKRIQEKYNLPENYVLFSFNGTRLSQEYIRSIASLLEQKGLAPVAFPMPERLLDFGMERKITLPLSPLDWYALIIHSNGYIGERMHPIVVCLHNNIPFFVFDEYGFVEKKAWGLIAKYNNQSSKTFHIVSKAGLTDNLWAYEGIINLPTPDDVVGALLGFDQQKCLDFSGHFQQDYETAMDACVKKLEKDGK